MVILGFTSCGRPTSTTSISCDEIQDVRETPFKKGEQTNDKAYNSLIAKGKAVLPCLADKITDTRLTPDPRSAPSVAGITVGDVAVFVFCDIADKEIEAFVPESIAKRFKTEGVYAYFEFVQKNAENRAVVQRNARESLGRNK